MVSSNVVVSYSPRRPRERKAFENTLRLFPTNSHQNEDLMLVGTKFNEHAADVRHRKAQTKKIGKPGSNSKIR